MSAKKALLDLGFPKCKNIGKKGGLPPLYGSDGLTDFPRKGDNKKICFSNSEYALFPFDVAVSIGRLYPKAWCKGGNYFGNYAMEHWFNATEAMAENREIPKESLRWMKKREMYIARHRKDFRLAGIIAMIKWAGFVDGNYGRGKGSENGSSLNYMLKVIEDYGK